MTLLRLAFRRQTAIPMLALAFASMTSVALVILRICQTGNLRYTFLVWNLFLAWLPMVFALLACDNYRNSMQRSWRLGSLAGAWLLFLPNAPYICTDLIHLNTHFFAHFWVDMTLILLCAVTGLVLGFVSLYLMQSLVARLYGKAASWLLMAVAAGLSGVGIYIGRFLRFNSWDIVFKPMAIYHGVGAWVTDPSARPNGLGFPMLFGAFLFVTYLMFYALTHLQPDQEMALGPAAAEASRS